MVHSTASLLELGVGGTPNGPSNPLPIHAFFFPVNARTERGPRVVVAAPVEPRPLAPPPPPAFTSCFDGPCAGPFRSAELETWASIPTAETRQGGGGCLPPGPADVLTPVSADGEAYTGWGCPCWKLGAARRPTGALGPSTPPLHTDFLPASSSGWWQGHRLLVESTRSRQTDTHE